MRKWYRVHDHKTDYLSIDGYIYFGNENTQIAHALLLILDELKDISNEFNLLRRNMGY